MSALGTQEVRVGRGSPAEVPNPVVNSWTTLGPSLLSGLIVNLSGHRLGFPSAFVRNERSWL